MQVNINMDRFVKIECPECNSVFFFDVKKLSENSLVHCPYCAHQFEFYYGLEVNLRSAIQKKLRENIERVAMERIIKEGQSDKD